MAISISSAKFSFIRFEAVAYSLPAYRQFDAGFQFMVEGYYEINKDLILGVVDMSGVSLPAFASQVKAVILSYKYRMPLSIVGQSIFLFKISAGTSEVIYNKQISYPQFKAILSEDFGYEVNSSNSFTSKNLTEIIISYAASEVDPETKVTLEYFWGMGYVRANSDLISPVLKYNSCFRYTLTDNIGLLVGITNSFKVIRTDKFTTLTYYSNNESEFGFVYNGDTLNVVRLPFYLSRPQYKEERSILLKSSGGHKLLSSQLEKQYELRTEFINADLHEFMRIMLSHDNIVVEASYLKGAPLTIVNSDDYNPSWQDDEEYDLAQAKTNVLVGDFGYTNDNMEQVDSGCPTPIFSIDSVADTAATLSFKYPDGISKILINYKQTGTSLWQIIQIAPAATYTILGLLPATDYDLRVAAMCLDLVGSFGRVKSALTTGVKPCGGVSNLTFMERTGNILKFQVDLPSPEPGSIDALVTRPDSTTFSQNFATSGFVANPFPFNIDLGQSNQFGNYSVRVRSVCSPGNTSTYSPEQIVSFQNQPQLASVQYNFTVNYDLDGTFDLYVNNISIEHTNASQNGFKNINKDDQIKVAVRSRTAFAQIIVYDQDTQAVLYDSGTGNYQADFQVTAAAGKKYYIDAKVNL